MEDNGVVCMYPWVHFAYTMQGKLRPCCRFSTTDEHLHNTSIDDYENAFGWLRKRMLYGVETEACKTCYTQGNNSMRADANIRFDLAGRDLNDDFIQLETIEISLDNLCNLECKMCNSQFSSKLYKRDELLNTIDVRLNGKPKKVPKNRIDEILALSIDWSKLRWIKILGGEPFMSPHFNKLLQKIVDNGRPMNTTLEIITNATHKLTDPTIELLLKFKELKVTASIDGAGKHNDYQRVGSNVKETIKQYAEYLDILPNIRLPHIHSTYTVLNLNYLVSDMHYWKQNHPGWGVSIALVNTEVASNLSPYHCPDYYYKWLNDQLKTDRRFALIKAEEALDLIAWKGIGYNEERWNGMLTEIKVLDDFYNIKLEDHNKPFYDLLKKHNAL